jgi:hypothetical protein
VRESLALISKHLPTIASLLVGAIPLVVLIQWFGVPRKLILGWGILSYIIGVGVFKMPMYHLIVVRVLHRRLSNVWLGISQGFGSAVSELGSAFLFFLFVVPELTLAQLIGFGAAAGAVEAIVLPFMGNPFEGTPLEGHSAEVEQRASLRSSVRWLGVLERVFALITHITARGLIYISIVAHSLVPGLIAIVTFAALDGRGYYAHLEKWAFDDVKVLRRFYAYFATVALIQLSSFLFFYPLR